MLGNTRFISRVEHNISHDIMSNTRNKSGISVHPCIILYIILLVLDISWVCGNGENLPFEDNSFDIYTIAFGIRNFTNIEKVYANCQVISFTEDWSLLVLLFIHMICLFKGFG